MTTPVPTTSSSLAIQPGQAAFTPVQVASLRQLGLDQAEESDLAVFFHTCVRTGLDPFRKQIYMIGRWDNRARRTRYTIQTGIDGYRVIANRTGTYVGSDETWHEGTDGRPHSATVTVRKLVNGVPFDFSATAHWTEYSQTDKDGKPAGLWAKMPHRMLAKCAEALALRKAFPEDLAGIYTDEEMSQAGEQPAPAATPVRTTIETKVTATPPKALLEDPYGWCEVEFAVAESVAALDMAARLAKPHLSDEQREKLRPLYLEHRAALEETDQ